VGEVAAVLPLLKLMAKELPGWQIVLSTVTLTGQKVASEKIGDTAVVIYFPLDMALAVRRAMKLVSPSLIVLVETEIWPNFLAAAARRRIPIAIVNGRISDRSYRNYRRVRSLLRRFLEAVDVFGMQTDLDAQRIRELGAPPDRIVVAGNMKFDCGISPDDGGRGRQVAASLGLRPGRQVIVAGSTHRGEEEIVLDVVQEVRRQNPGIILILVPRHPERAAEVMALAEAKGERCALRSRVGSTPVDYTVLIVDTVGELADIYRCATVAFVGKSLVGGGGQNIIEPASMGKPLLFGPSMHNFREAAEILLRSKAAIQVADARGLREAIASLLQDGAAREAMGRRAAEAMARSRGATRRNLDLISKQLSRVSRGHLT
jgi:3-deoxy-D-manno-octulosonic-acid transferase